MSLGVTSNVYDGATSRLLYSVYTVGPVRRETHYLHEDLGEQVGTVQDNVTNHTDVTYELLSSHWWRVTRETTVGSSANVLALTRERLTELSNGVLLVTNFYDAKSRRVKMVTPTASHTFVYDGWNLIEERVAYANGSTSTIHYYWGKDISGTFQGAGGVGGLVAASDIAKFNAQYGGLTVRTSVKFHDRLLYSSLVISAGIQYRF